jgi:uncharacterized protein YdcH (DUF465 family)
MKTLYDWYCKLKERATEMEQNSTVESSNQYEALKKRKKELQIELHQYQQEHKDKNGPGHGDTNEIEPIKQKYKEYKVQNTDKAIKKQLEQLEQEQQ